MVQKLLYMIAIMLKACWVLGKKLKRRERNKKKIIINGIKRLKCASFLVLYNCRDKEPDKCGEGRYLEGWKDTVMSARLNAGVWLEHALYQRCDIPFRGFSVHHQPQHNQAQIFLVNAVGDLFASTLSLSQNFQDDDASEKDFSEYDELLENWGNKVYQDQGHVKLLSVERLYQRNMITTMPVPLTIKRKFDKKAHRSQMKKGGRILVDIQTDDNAEEKRKYLQWGLPELGKNSEGTAVKYGKLSISQDYHPLGPAKTGLFPGFKTTGLSFTNEDDETGQKILEMFGGKGLLDGRLEEENGEEEDKEEPPTEEDPDYALKTFLADLYPDDEDLSRFEQFLPSSKEN